MLLFALSLLFGHGYAAACAAAPAAGCTPVPLGTTADPISQMSIVVVDLYFLNGCTDPIMQWEFGMSGPVPTTTTAVAAGAGPILDFKMATDCVRLGTSAATCTSGACTWGLAYAEAGSTTCALSGGTGVTTLGSTCIRLNGEATSGHTFSKVKFTPTLTGQAATVPGNIYRGTGVTTADETNIFGSTKNANNHPEVTLIVWKDLAKATCLNSEGTGVSGTDNVASYKLFCNGQVATIQPYTAKACPDASKTTLAAAHTLYDSSGTAVVSRSIVMNAATAANSLGASDPVHFKASNIIDPCIKLNPPGSGGPASALNTAAAAAVLAAGALIL